METLMYIQDNISTPPKKNAGIKVEIFHLYAFMISGKSEVSISRYENNKTLHTWSP